MNKNLIIGAGVMGTALAVHLANNGQDVSLWGTKWDSEAIDLMKKTKRHEALGVDIPDNISYFYHDEMEEAFKDTKLVIIAVLSGGMESISEMLSPYINKDHIILSVTKGIDEKNQYTMSQIIKNALKEELKDKVGIVKLGGPIIATELAQGRYTEGVFASKDLKAAEYARDLFRTPKFKGGITDDILGVDLCAAFKNSYAIGMGIIEGLEGDTNNPKAALMARGTMEMGKIVEAYGGSKETALGIAGIGDYYVTAQGGRNGKFGKLLAEDNTIEESLEIMEGATVEGLAVTLNGYTLLKKLEDKGQISIEKDTPLFLEIYKILYEEKPVRDGIDSYWISD